MPLVHARPGFGKGERGRAPRKQTMYDFRTIERAWQQRWEETRLYATRLDDARPPYYVLEMLP
ncbi:MAG: hypothetical protein JO140_03345, partial [Candidatus Eremiobacteraeota bacterium]|nr:hypothetical protein [Candidatus Eremiobacteraeota bacterium]